MMMSDSNDSWDKFRGSIGMTLFDSIDLMSSILEAETSESLQIKLGLAVQKVGFSTFVAGVQMTDVDGAPAHHVISGYPVEWQRIYAQREYIWTDPTVVHCRSSQDPLVWSQDVFEQHNGIPMWEEAKAFGLSHGISVALHEGSGTKSMLSLVRDQAVDRDEEERDQLISAVKVLAGCAHFVAVRIAKNVLRTERDMPRLTPQEVECLKWVSKGKTSWEIGRIMAISEPTVAFHVKNAMGKLGANNRPQALAVAIRLGLIN